MLSCCSHVGPNNGGGVSGIPTDPNKVTDPNDYLTAPMYLFTAVICILFAAKYSSLNIPFTLL